MAWFIPFLIGMTFSVVSHLIMPMPKAAKPDAARDMDDPTAEAGRPIPVVFGTITVKGLNVLGYWDKSIVTYKIRA